MTPRPIPFTWDGEVMRPRKGYARQCDQMFTVGEGYILVEEKPRNMAQHGGYFARLTEAWRSLPEHLADRFPSAEHLRKRALIFSGYADVADLVAASTEHATAMVTAMRRLDGYAVIEAQGKVVRLMTAKSQSVKAMGSKEFKESIDAVERWVADLIGASIDDYRRAAA